MYAALLLVSSLVAMQETLPELALGEDRVVSLRADDPALDGRGPSRRFVVSAPGAGTLYVQFVDRVPGAFLRVTSRDGKVNGSEGCVAWPPCVIAPVAAAAERRVITVSACDALTEDAGLDVTLRVAFAADGDAALDAAARIRAAIADASRLKNAGDPRSALRTISEIAALLTTTPDPTESRVLSDAAGELAPVAYALGATNAVLDAARCMADHRARFQPSDHPQVLAARSRVGVGYYALGRLADARQTFESILLALERTTAGADQISVSSTGNLAAVLLAQGETKRARVLFQRAADAQAAALGEVAAGTLTMRANVVAAMLQEGDVEGALALGERVMKAQESVFEPSSRDLLSNRMNVALAAGRCGDLDRAATLLAEVVAIREATLAPEHPDLLAAQTNLASNAMARGDYATAATMRTRVLQNLEHSLPEEHPDRLGAEQNLGVVRVAEHRLDEALALFRHSEAIYERLLRDDHPTLKIARRNRFVTHVARGETKEAAALFDALLRGAEARAADALLLPTREAEQRANLDVDVVRSALALGQFGSPHTLERTFGLAATLSMLATGTTTPDTRASHQTRVAREALSEARRALADHGLVGPHGDTSSDAFRDELLALTLAKDRAEARVLEQFEALGCVTSPPTAATVAGKLAVGHAVVFVVSRPLYEVVPNEPLRDHGNVFTALVLTGTGSVTSVELGSVAAIEAAIEAWRTEIELEAGAGSEPRVDSDERKRARSLAELVYEPLRAALPDSVAWHVIWDGVLHAVALDALPCADGSLVGDHVRIALLPSLARFVTPTPLAPTDPSLVAVGGADFAAHVAAEDDIDVASRALDAGATSGASFVPLPNTEVEAATVARRFHETFATNATVLTRAEASKYAFARAVEGARFVHVATHGWFAPESIESRLETMSSATTNPALALIADQRRLNALAPSVACGLAFAGANAPPDVLGRNLGLLTAEELAGLDLSQCSLCVLSACESNVGVRRAGLGMRSLQAAVHAAGARCAITTLWAVDDAATRVLMERFYEELWTRGSSVADALWSAKRAMRELGAPTAHWAGFVLSGDPDAR